MITYGLVEADSAVWTVASYFEKKLDEMLPPRVGVISCHANGTRKTLTPWLAK
jgi:hypothetical protein